MQLTEKNADSKVNETLTQGIELISPSKRVSLDDPDAKTRFNR